MVNLVAHDNLLQAKKVIKYNAGEANIGIFRQLVHPFTNLFLEFDNSLKWR